MTDKVFSDLKDVVAADDPIDDQMSTIESLCMNCGRDGTTRLLLTEIPFFKQVVIMSFECPHCHYTNNELQPAQQIAERAVRFAVTCDSPQDLSRRVVKTEWAEVAIPEIEFEVKKQTGLITTVEGVLDRAVEGLQQTIRASPDLDPEARQKFSDFLVKINALKDGKQKFTFIITDISGNSFVENLCAPDNDPKIVITHYDRSGEEDRLIGIFKNEDTNENAVNEAKDDLKDEVLQFATNCSNCGAAVCTNMKVTDIPHFKEIVIMATNCESCGHKTNEVKSGGGIGHKGVCIRVKVESEDILKKEVVISETCSISIPELDIDITSTGSGRYTTVEGIGLAMIEELKRSNPFIEGDSAHAEMKHKLEAVFAKLSDLVGYTIVLDDPCGNSYVEDAQDVRQYERSFEQNEELGVNDMKTENY